MLKKLVFLFILIINLFAIETIYVSPHHAYTLDKNKKLLIFEYQKINDTLDIFNLKDKKLSSSFGSIGDMNGFKLNFIYGLKNNLTILTTFQKQTIQYGSGNLINYYYNISGKYKFYENEHNYAAFDIGLKSNIGKKINFSNKKYLENLAKKFLNVKQVKIQNNKIGVIKNDGTTEFLNLKEPPSIDIDNLKDNSIYFTLNYEKFVKRIAFDIFSTFKYTKIYTDIKANIIPADTSTQNKLSKYNLSKNLNRDEKSIDLGFNIAYKAPIIVNFSYLYKRIFRDKDLNYINYNHIITLNFIKPITEKFFVYIGGKAMYRQFNGEIPYLYNKYSQTTFDHKYGWANVGIGYSF
jgi:hypothetical protein